MKKISIALTFALFLILSGCSEKSDNSLVGPQIEKNESLTSQQFIKSLDKTASLKNSDISYILSDSGRPKGNAMIRRDTIK
jgi:hypothetical protein